MRLRLLLALVIFAGSPAAMAPSVMAHGTRAPVDSRVHDRGICWDPDVEFPVPCDDDDD